MSERQKRDDANWTAALVAILLVAFSLRVTQLERQPLWWDEGNSIYFAHQTLHDLISETRITNDTDPPIYRLSLSIWQAAGGSSPFSIRLFSVLLGMAAIALTWAIGRWLADKRVATLAALLMALAPMQVHYAREAKGYPMAMVCSLLSVFVWGHKLGYLDFAAMRRDRSLGWWVIYVASTAAAIATHYYLALLVLWQGLGTMGQATLTPALSLRGRERKLIYLGQWLLAAGAAALLLSPWVVVVFHSTVNGVSALSGGHALSPLGYLSQVGGEFGAGTGMEGLVAPLAAGVLAILALAGGLAEGKRPFLLSWVALPLAAAYGLQMRYPFFFPRFLLYLGPPCYLLLSHGIIALGQRRLVMMASLAAVVIALGIPGLVRIHAAPVDAAEDPRPLIAYIQKEAQPGDALVHVYIWEVGYLLSYYPQHKLSLYRAYYTTQNVGAKLQGVFADHPRLWLWSYRIAAEDPHNLPASWLEAEAYKLQSIWYGRHNLVRYLTPDFQTPGAGPGEKTASFGERIELTYPVINARLRPGDALTLPLRWRALAAVGEDYHVFLHFGLPGVPPLAQSDGAPRNGLEPTSRWSAGHQVMDRRALLLPDNLAPGRYALLVGLYRATDGARLLVSDSDGQDTLLIGFVQVEP